MSRLKGTRCFGPQSIGLVGGNQVYYDQWVEPGQLRRVATSANGSLALVIGSLEDQDPHQHDRTIPWLVVHDDRLVTTSLKDIGEWYLVYPDPG